LNDNSDHSNNFSDVEILSLKQKIIDKETIEKLNFESQENFKIQLENKNIENVELKRKIDEILQNNKEDL
jgi:hypothetical protein